MVFVSTENEIVKYEVQSQKLIEKGRKEIGGILKLVFGTNQRIYGLTRGEIIQFHQQSLNG